MECFQIVLRGVILKILQQVVLKKRFGNLPGFGEALSFFWPAPAPDTHNQ